MNKIIKLIVLKFKFGNAAMVGVARSEAYDYVCSTEIAV